MNDQHKIYFDWQDNVDVEILRDLEQDGFDLSKDHKIGFYIDFFTWPPSEDAILSLKREGYEITLVHPQYEDELGYILTCLTARVNCQLVQSMKLSLTMLMKPFGARCTSWHLIEDTTHVCPDGGT